MQLSAFHFKSLCTAAFLAAHPGHISLGGLPGTHRRVADLIQLPLVLLRSQYRPPEPNDRGLRSDFRNGVFPLLHIHRYCLPFPKTYAPRPVHYSPESALRLHSLISNDRIRLSHPISIRSRHFPSRLLSFLSSTIEMIQRLPDIRMRIPPELQNIMLSVQDN